jgi:hypothetical protein
VGDNDAVEPTSRVIGALDFDNRRTAAYGTCRLAEGADVTGRRALVVEDVVTSGGQIVLSTADLRAPGAEVREALCVIDREQGGAAASEQQAQRLAQTVDACVLGHRAISPVLRADLGCAMDISEAVIVRALSGNSATTGPAR